MTESKRQSGSKKTHAARGKNPESPETTPPQNDSRRKRYRQVIFHDWCKSCGICSAFCPKNVLGRDKAGSPVVEHPEQCVGCRFCELHCPDFAITIEEETPDREEASS